MNYEIRADFKGAIPSVRPSPACSTGKIIFSTSSWTWPLREHRRQTGFRQAANYDLVKLKASFEMPLRVPAPIPAVLMLHGYGENRKVWEALRKQFLDRGWAVMTLDLRGHGDSLSRNQRPLQANPDWRTSPRDFPLDVDPALDWLKKQTRLNSRKIVIIGTTSARIWRWFPVESFDAIYCRGESQSKESSNGEARRTFIPGPYLS
jgi:predicted dienelactone hydrolase